MSTYRPNYQDYPPLPPNMPPLPRGPLPALIWSGNGDSYRPSPLGYYPQEHIPQSDFSFRNTKYAPQYPQEQDFSRGIQPAQYTRQSDSRPRARNNHRDDANLNRHRRGNYHYTRPYRVAPVDRPLLRRQNDGGDSPEQMLGMATGQAKFLAAGDVSDSEEEVMDESESEAGRGEENHEELGTIYLTGDQHVDGGGSEAPAKRRATAAGARDGASEPKWSNPDPYTVLPPIDDEQRKRKDVVKLIRKARKDADDANIAEHNQVIANDDFISFGMDDDPPAVIEEIPSSPSADPRENFGADVAGAPSKPRPFSHLQNLHNQNNGAPGTNGQSVVADSMGPPPGLAQAPKAPPALPNRIILDTAPSNARESIEAFQDKALGNGRRTHDDFIKGGSGPWGKAKGKKAKATGPILQEWVPNPGIDATPWLQRSGILTANAGFRLHKEICDFYEFVRPQDFEQNTREELLSRVQTVIDDEVPHASVHCFGSFAAGLYLPTADMDVVVISNSFRSSSQKVICQSNTQMFKFGKFLESSGLAAQGSVEVITQAKVPIIKFVDRITAIRIDVSFENDTGIIANDTFAMWKKQYPAMPILVTVIKQFLMMRGLNEVMTGGLGGFSVTCLVTSLLQNMPRVQSGELVPEQHLGEILIEFLDFYGNQLDTMRTGLMMHPPGYFEKRAFTYPNAKRQIYNANKVDRLAIMDPNRPANDISGGSSQVMLIFDRFSKAHAEILKAMKAPNRPSLLDWSLAGNYESFVCQRNRLLDLYRERWETPAGIPDQYEIPKQSVPASQVTGLTGDNKFSVTESQGHVAFKNQEIVDDVDNVVRNGPAEGKEPSARATSMVSRQATQPNRFLSAHAQAPNNGLSNGKFPSVHAANTVSSQAKKSKPKSSANPGGDKSRAVALKKQFPNANNIPKSVTKQEKKALVAQLTGNTNITNPVGPTNLTHQVPRNQVSAPQKSLFDKQLTNPGLNYDKAKKRAGVLKESYPKLAGLIPDAISSSARKTFIETHGKRGQKQQVIYELEPNPPREVRKTAENLGRQQEQYPGAQFTPLNPSRYPSSSSFQTVPQIDKRPARVSRYPIEPADKMAPLSDERRAEVARNLSGTSQDEPIEID